MWLFYAFLSAFFGGLVAILGKAGLKNIDTTLATIIRSVIMTLFLLAVGFSLKKFNGFSPNCFGVRDWILIILAGIAGALSWIFFFSALQSGDASKVIAIDRLSILFVLILAILFLGESFSFRALIGALLMIGGAFLISVYHF